MLVFEERGKPEYPEKNRSEQGREPTTNKLNPHMTSSPEIEPGPQWWVRRVLSPLRHPCSPLVYLGARRFHIRYLCLVFRFNIFETLK